MDHPDKAIRTFRRHLALLFVLKYALPLLTAYAFVWGTAVLVLRAAADVERKPLLWGLSGLAVCLAFAVLRTRRHLPPATAIRALLDEQSGCGGLLMAGAEQELGGWEQRLPMLTPPRVRWDARRGCTLLAVAAGFVLLCFLAPKGLADLSSDTPLDIDREITRLLSQIALLKSESILDPKRAETLAEKMKELSEHSSGKEPGRTLEALDHLRNLTQEAARQGAEKNTRSSQRLGEAQALAEALMENADLIDPKLAKQVLEELAGLMDKDQFDPELMEALRQQKLNPQQLNKLAQALAGNMGNLMRRMGKLHKTGLIDDEMLTRCRKAGECDCEGLREYLCKNKCYSLDDLKSHCKIGGKGGINRGPGAAPMTWGKPGSEEGFQFKEEVLPPSALDTLKSTPLQEIRGGNVVHKKGSAPAASGALNDAAAGSGSANTAVILPRHRASVERYFERPTPKK
jgi:chorismate mutase